MQNSNEPIFNIQERFDYLNGSIDNTPYPFSVCVPVNPKNAPSDAVSLPSCRALSVLHFGDYSTVDEAWLMLGREVRTQACRLSARVVHRCALHRARD